MKNTNAVVRLIQCDKEDGQTKSYFQRGEKNPCGCGSNCYHYEFDGKRVIGVCNACKQDIYEVKPEFTEKYLALGTWAPDKKCAPQAKTSGLERLTTRVDGRLKLTKDFPSIEDTLEILTERLEIMELLLYADDDNS